VPGHSEALARLLTGRVEKPTPAPRLQPEWPPVDVRRRYLKPRNADRVKKKHWEGKVAAKLSPSAIVE
jgi:hypothetical protein